MIKSVFSQFKYFNYPAFLLAFTAGISLLFMNTGDLILYFNQDRNDLVINVMKIITQLGEEPMYILFFIVFLFLKLRHALLIPMVAIMSVLVSFTLKGIFYHPRPREFYKEAIHIGEFNLLEGVHLFGGYTSFPSGHTISAFCIFGIAAFVSSKYVKKGFWQFLFFVLAALVAYSRIYLFQHFLKDVTFGAFLGTSLAILIAWFSERLFSNPNGWYQKNLIEALSKEPEPKA